MSRDVMHAAGCMFDLPPCRSIPGARPDTQNKYLGNELPMAQGQSQSQSYRERTILGVPVLNQASKASFQQSKITCKGSA
eukprot:49736-Chlamydomonas_euryale.AAC.3